MAEQIKGKLEIVDNNDNVIFSFDPEDTKIHLHTKEGKEKILLWGKAGNIITKSSSDKAVLTIDNRYGDIYLTDKADEDTIQLPIYFPKGTTCLLRGKTAEIRLGMNGKSGKLQVNDSKALARVSLNGKGDIHCNNTQGENTISLRGRYGDIELGGNKTNGVLKIKNKEEKESIHLNGESSEILLRTNTGKETIALEGRTGNLTLGGNGQEGDLFIKDKWGNNTISLDGILGDIFVGGKGQENKPTISLYGAIGHIYIGGNGEDGRLFVNDSEGNAAILLEGRTGKLTLGGIGQDGDLILKNKEGITAIGLNGDTSNISLRTNTGKVTIAANGVSGNLTLGGNGQDGDLFVRNKEGKSTVEINGESGDIILHNADFAEDFDIENSQEIDPGTVMVLTKNGKLTMSQNAYDKKVAGIISGAGDFKPGLVMDKKPAIKNRMPIAMVGKVYCKANAEYGPIEVGDLLTTSPTPGHAMKATDPLKAFGAVLGKALQPLASGRRMIPVLVSLQ